MIDARTAAKQRISVGALVYLVLVLMQLSACTSRNSTPKTPQGPTVPAQTTERISGAPLEVPTAIEKACGTCHATPRPDRFTDRTWQAAIPYMYWLFDRFYPEDKPKIPQDEVLSFYKRNAAKAVKRPRLYPQKSVSSPKFRLSPLVANQGPMLTAAIESLPHAPRSLLVVNMLLGQINKLDLSTSPVTSTTLANAVHPTRAIPADLDGNGRGDYLILELSTFGAKDIQRGRALAVLNENGVAETVPVLSGVGRIADASVGDLDGDGIPELIIADFGWQKTGGLHLLNRLSQTGSPLKYGKRTLDPQAGYVALALADMDGDGDRDLVTGMAQHHERIDLWINDGRGQFNRRLLFKGDSPMWGLIGLRVVDIDGDGDDDILHFNGDTLDAPKVAGFQGVHLLRNQGDGRFQQTQLAQLPGTHSVDTADFDGDGRLDIVAVANLPTDIHETLWSSDKIPEKDVVFESVILLRQTADTGFEVHSVLRNEACFSAVRAIDSDGDGDQDIVLGPFGVGWSLLGHGQTDRSAEPHRICDRDQLYWLENLGGRGMTERHPSLANRGSPAPARRLQALQTITRNDPTDVGYQISLSDALLKAGRFSEANQSMKAAVRSNPEDARALFQSSCQAGKLDACTNLGVLYYDGEHLKKDLAKAATLYDRACAGGEGNACANLALMHGAGDGVPQDEAKAMTLLDKACTADHLGACAQLGEIYGSGPSDSQQLGRARALLKRACSGGVPQACSRLATLGKAPSAIQPSGQSIDALEQACSAGHTPSCSQLSDRYARGQGVVQNMSRAVQYATTACQGGDAESCGNAGGAYLGGTGVPQDLGRARQLFEKACRGGIQRACDFLKKLPGTGP